MRRLNVNGNSTPPAQNLQPDFQANDYNAFPSLQGNIPQQWPPEFHPQSFESIFGSSGAVAPPPGFNNFVPTGPSLSRSHSRPSSRHTSRATTPLPGVDDNEAFPSLGAAAGKSGKRHHGKRGGHGHGHRDATPSSLADVVRMSPSPVPAQGRRGPKSNKSFTGSRENSAAAQAIPPPEHIPWLDTGDVASSAYMKARREAFKHGGLRNKFLQSAAQAWNRNDSRGAKALSLRGQSENEKMRVAHREASRVLYEERNKDIGKWKELYVDLHGKSRNLYHCFRSRPQCQLRLTESMQVSIPRKQCPTSNPAFSNNAIRPGPSMSSLAQAITPKTARIKSERPCARFSIHGDMPFANSASQATATMLAASWESIRQATIRGARL